MKFVLPVLVVVALLAALFVGPPHIFLVLGVLSVSEVALDYLIGILFIGYFVHKI